MFKKIMNKKMLNNEKGLTLIELLAVIVILAIISAIAIPAIGNVISNSKDKAILSDAAVLLSGAKIAIADGACGAADTSSVITCKEPALKDVFEGAVDPTDTVTYNTSTKVYTVKYSILGGIKNITKFTTSNGFTPGPNSTSITNAQLTAAMSK